MEVRCILTNFTPKFHPFSNLKAQILEIWPSAQESANKNRAAMKSRYLYYRPKVDQMAPAKGIILLLDLQEDSSQVQTGQTLISWTLLIPSYRG